MSWAASRSVVRVLAAAAALGCLAVVFLSPVLRRPGRNLYIGAGLRDAGMARFLANDPAAQAAPQPDGWGLLSLGDTLRSVYTVAWWTRALSGNAGSRSLYDANTLHPTPRSLAYSDLQLGVVPWFAPGYLATGNPVLGYNLALLAGLLGCALGFFLLLRSWTGSTAAGLVAGVASVVAPFRVEGASLVYLHLIAYLPAALLCVDAVLAGRRPILVSCVLAGCLALQASSSAYLAFACALLVPIYGLGVLLEDRGRASARSVLSLLAAGGAAAAILALVYAPILEHTATGSYGVAQGPDGPVYNQLMIMTWAVPRTNLARHFLWSCGIPVLVLAIFGLLHAPARRRWTLATVVVVGGVLALGARVEIRPDVWVKPLPWDWFARVVPGFTLQRHSYMTMLLVGVGLIGLAGLGAAWLAARVRARPAWLVVPLVLAAVSARAYDWRISPTRMVRIATGAEVPAAYRWLAAHGEGGALLELPSLLAVNAVYAYFSTHHWLPILNGSYAHPPPGHVEMLAESARFLEARDAADALLRRVPVRWVLVHGGFLLPEQFAALATAPPHLVEVARFDRDILYETRAVTRR